MFVCNGLNIALTFCKKHLTKQEFVALFKKLEAKFLYNVEKVKKSSILYISRSISYSKDSNCNND